QVMPMCRPGAARATAVALPMPESAPVMTIRCGSKASGGLVGSGWALMDPSVARPARACSASPVHHTTGPVARGATTRRVRWRVGWRTVTEQMRQQTEIDRLAEAHLDAVVAMSPMQATYLGVAGLDDKIDDLSVAGMRAVRDQVASTLESL